MPRSPLPLLGLALALALAGCFGGTPETQPGEPAPPAAPSAPAGPLTQEKATLLADSAMAELAAALEGTDGSELRRITGQFHVSPAADAQDPTQQLFGGPVDVQFSTEWGQSDVARVILEMRFGGLSFTLETWCTPGEDLLVWGGQTYASRPSGQRGSCMPGAFLDPDTQGNPLDGLDPEHLDRMDVTINKNGTITATYRDDNGTFTLLLDQSGRPLAMDFSGPEATGEMSFDYGARAALSPPSPTARLAAPNHAFAFDGANYTVFGPSQAPLSEMEVRVLGPDGAMLASFDPARGGTQNQGGYAFRYQDDGDGRFGMNDTFRLEGPEPLPTVQIWDEWAGRATDDNPIPGLGLALVPVGFLAAAAVGRGGRRDR